MAAALLPFVGSSASAAYIGAVGPVILDYGDAHSGNGGEFVVKSNGTDGSTAFVNAIKADYSSLATYGGIGFETFCLEYNEHFSPGGTYNASVSPEAVHGGNVTNDPISVGTAYLYSLFATGNLPGYDYTASTTSSSAANLQNTIWFLEGEQTSLPGGALIANPGTYSTLLITEFGSLTNAMANSYNLKTAASYGVSALNLGAAPEFTAQDQIFYQKTSNQDLPDGGATLLLLGLSLSGMGVLQRRMRRTA